MKIKDLINGEVIFDKMSGYFFIKSNKGDVMLAEIRGWGHIQNMFRNKSGIIEFDEAGKFQDEVGFWIAEAINEKMKKELKKEIENV
jgi:hypothetical protein